MGSFDLLYGEWAFYGWFGHRVLLLFHLRADVVGLSCGGRRKMWVLLRNDGFCQNIRHISYEFFENVQNYVFVRWLCTCVYILCYCRCVAGLLAVGSCSLPPCFLTMSLLFCTSCSHPEIQRSRLPLHLLLVLPPRITQHLIWQLLHLLELHARRDLCLILVDDLPNRIHHIIQLLLAKPRRRLESPITSVNSYHHYAPLPNEKKSEPKSSKVQKFKDRK